MRGRIPRAHHRTAGHRWVGRGGFVSAGRGPDGVAHDGLVALERLGPPQHGAPTHHLPARSSPQRHRRTGSGQNGGCPKSPAPTPASTGSAHASLPLPAGEDVAHGSEASEVRAAVAGSAAEVARVGASAPNPLPLPSFVLRPVRLTWAVLKPVGLRWRCLWWKSLWSACFRQSESAERFPINVHDS